MLNLAIIRVQVLSVNLQLSIVLAEGATDSAVVGPDGETDERGVTDGGLRQFVGLL